MYPRRLTAEADAARALAEQETSELRMAFNAMLQVGIQLAAASGAMAGR